MDPFTIWLTGAVLTDAYQRVISRLNTKSAEDSLAEHVRAEVGRYPKRVFRLWYRAPETHESLVKGGQQSFESLVDRLIATSSNGIFSRKLSLEHAEEIVRAAVTGFVGSLDPSDAVNVADSRSAERDFLLAKKVDHRTGELRAHLDERLDSVESRLEGAADFDHRASQLPTPAQPFFQAAGPTQESLRVLDFAAADEPRAALIQLTADLPPWLHDASAATLLAAAELCRSYRVHHGAAQLFELAADRSGDRGYYYARAAAELAVIGEADRSSELIDQAKSLSTAAAVAAIAAALTDDAATVLEVLPADDALQDPYLVTVRLYGLRTASTPAEVISFLTDALERHPESPGLMIELAWAHLRRSQEPDATTPTGDRNTALELALEARELRRKWRAEAADATRVACQAALSLSAFDRVIQIGMAPPEGEARPGEAADVDVRLTVAQAAIARGNLDLLRTVADLVPEGFHRALMQADVLAHTDASPAAVAAAYDTVWAQAYEDEQRVLYWLSASAAGIDIHGVEDLQARTDEVPLVVSAQLHLARGEHETAITLLRQHKRTEHTTRLLVDALLGSDDVHGAVDELKIAATRFNDTMYLVWAVEILGQAGRMSDAAVLAEEGLQRVPRVLTEPRAFLHEVLVENAGMSEQWGEMALRSRAWIEDLGRSPRNRWHLAMALYQGGDRPGSWRILQEPPELQPTTANQARLWTAAAAYEAPSPGVADRIVALIDGFPNDKALTEGAVGLFFARGEGIWGEVRPETIARYQELLTAQAVDFKSDEDAAIRVLTGTAQEMLEQLRPALEVRARVIEEMSEKIRQGWPYGMLASTGADSYTSALVHRAAGCFPIATTNAARTQNEAEAALAALGGLVVVDVSTLVTNGYLRQVWPQLRSSFSRIHFPRPALLDVRTAVEEFRRPSSGTLYYDHSIQSVRAIEAEPATNELLLDHAEWVSAQADELIVSDWPKLMTLNREPTDGLLPWLSALDMAKARGLPLWCDDLGLRTLAASDGVATFGTTALIAALAAEGKLEDGAARGALRQLRQQYAVDLPLDVDWLRLSAASEEWRPGPAAYYFSRAAAWSNLKDAYALWSELAQLAATAEPVRVAGWVHAAALGLCQAIAGDRASKGIAAIAAKGIVVARFDSEAVGACAARVREVALAAGIPNPVPTLMATIFEHLTDAMGAEAAARLMMSADLADPDRIVVRDLVFSLRPDQGQSEV